MSAPAWDRDPFPYNMPLVTTRSEGGVHDDESYVAGWEMGELFATLHHVRPRDIERQIRTASLPQLQRLVREYGYVYIAGRDVAGWTWVSVWRP